MADGVNDRFDFTQQLPALEDVPAAHLIAIGGSGMSGVARLFLERGIPVSGSGNVEVPVMDALRDAGARIHIGHEASNLDDLPPGSLVVVSSAIREDNPELAAARQRPLTVVHRSQGLAVLSADRAVLAVAGANGKTTTSAMATVALRGCGQEPSFAIGADIAGLGVNAAPGSGGAFVVEADESDGSFVVYHPDVAIVTNIRDDHLDFYGTSARLVQAYREFVSTIAPGGLLVACADDEGSAALAADATATGQRVLTYGRSSQADLRITDEQSSGNRRQARLRGAAGIDLELTLNVPGAHNVLNAAGVLLALVAGYDLPATEVAAALATFRGTSRRFEWRGEAGGVRVVDDYAHNAGKVEAVISTGLDLRGAGRLIAVFQPHLYSRTRDAADDLAAALTAADLAIVVDVYGAREEPMPGVSGRLISDQVPGAVFAPDLDAAVAAVLEHARPGDLVLTIGAGDITTIAPRILQQLDARG